MRMPQIVYADSLDTCRLAAPVHFVMQIVLGNLEYPVILLDAIKGTDAGVHFFCQKFRHDNGSDTLWRFRVGDHIFLLDTLIGLVDSDSMVREIKVPGSQCKQLSHA